MHSGKFQPVAHYSQSQLQLTACVLYHNTTHTLGQSKSNAEFPALLFTYDFSRLVTARCYQHIALAAN